MEEICGGGRMYGRVGGWSREGEGEGSKVRGKTLEVGGKRRKGK